MKQLKRVCNAARALSNQASVSLTGVPGPSDDMWRGVVSIGGVILVEYTGTIDTVVPTLIKKLEGMSQNMRARLDSGVSFPPGTLTIPPEEPKTQKMTAPNVSGTMPKVTIPEESEVKSKKG